MVREFDLIVVGATGFWGGLVAAWLTETQSTSKLRWAIAGRDSTKLEECRESVSGTTRCETPIEVCLVDISDEEQCATLVMRTKVILTTVGPYCLYGEKLIGACAKAGTHYCDLTGEIPFIKRMMGKYAKDAEASGSTIICCAGFDSLPVDVSNYAVAEFIRDTYNCGTRNAKSVYTRLKEGASGGTLLTVLTLRDIYSSKEILDAHKPWSISTVQGSKKQSNVPHVKYDDDFGTYIASWVGDSVDRSISARSWSLLHYGADWTTYGYISFDAWYKAWGFIVVLYLTGFILSISPLRYLLRQVVTQPGQGPSKSEIENSSFKLKTIGETDHEPIRKAIATFDSDRGGTRGSSAAMIGCVALTLVFDLQETHFGQHSQGGFYTPACLGKALIVRLRAAGFRLEVEERTG